MFSCLNSLFERLLDLFVFSRYRQKFYLILGGHIHFQVLSTGIRLGLFTLLARHRRLSQEQMAEFLGLDKKSLRVLLLGCAALGLIKKRGGGVFQQHRC